MINKEELINEYGIALILIKSLNPSGKDSIAEFVSEDDNYVTVKSLGVIQNKPHFDDIVRPDGSINPMFTVPDGYSNSRFDVILTDKSGQQQTIKKSSPSRYEEVRNRGLISQYNLSK